MPPLVNSRVSFGLKQLIFNYIDLRGDSLTPLEFSRVLHQLSLARDVKVFVEYCKQHFSDEWGPFNFCVYAYLVGVFQPWNSWRRYDLLDDWAPVLADVLSNGVDIHTSTWVHKPLAGGLEGLSAVHSIISMADSPQMALERCSLWLNLLEQVGVDIEQYLDVEISHCIATWDQKRKEKGTEFRKIFTIQEYGGRRMPCWIQEIDGACPIRELLLEFPHLQKGYILYYLDLKSSTVSELHRAWKDPMARKCLDGSSFWPFYPGLAKTMMDGLRGSWQSEEIKRQVSSLDWACYLVESRFERRQLRKLLKTGQKYPDGMPGAWVDGR